MLRFKTREKYNKQKCTSSNSSSANTRLKFWQKINEFTGMSGEGKTEKSRRKNKEIKTKNNRKKRY